MNDIPVVPPKPLLPAFSCPFCGAYAKQTWYKNVVGQTGFMYPGQQVSVSIADFQIGACEHCRETTVWIGQRLIFPLGSSAPTVHADMPADAKQVYEEGRLVLDASPRAAAALLRLCADMLCNDLNAKGNNLNEKIGSLVAKGLPQDVQRAFDSIRGFGNDALHPPAEILTEDDRDTALVLFDLINVIVEKTITEKKLIKRIYERLPEGVRNSVEKRDREAGDLRTEEDD